MTAVAEFQQVSKVQQSSSVLPLRGVPTATLELQYQEAGTSASRKSFDSCRDFRSCTEAISPSLGRVHTVHRSSEMAAISLWHCECKRAIKAIRRQVNLDESGGHDAF
jgi:hypothetical protein